MKIKEIVSILDADILCGEEHLENEVHSACGADMMSDVLAFVKEQAVLLTGLINPQVVRTAEMMDMRCIVFVRGKRRRRKLSNWPRKPALFCSPQKKECIRPAANSTPPVFQAEGQSDERAGNLSF